MEDQTSHSYSTTKPASALSLTETPAPFVFSSLSIQYIYTSWDIVTSNTDGKQQFGNMFFKSLAETPLSKWFDASDIQHTTLFINMIDMIVHILSPTEFDIISQELIALGKRHAQYSEDSVQMFHPSLFLHFSDCFCLTLMHFLNVKQNGPRNDQLRDIGIQAIQDAWEYLLSYIRTQMEHGAQSEHRRRSSLMEKRTRLISSSSSLVSPRSKKIEQESFKRTKSLSMRSCTSTHQDHSTVSSHQNKERRLSLSSSSPTSKLVSPRRVLFRFASFVSSTNLIHSAPSRTASPGHQRREHHSRDKSRH